MSSTELGLQSKKIYDQTIYSSQPECREYVCLRMNGVEWKGLQAYNQTLSGMDRRRVNESVEGQSRYLVFVLKTTKWLQRRSCMRSSLRDFMSNRVVECGTSWSFHRIYWRESERRQLKESEFKRTMMCTRRVALTVRRWWMLQLLYKCTLIFVTDR